MGFHQPVVAAPQPMADVAVFPSASSTDLIQGSNDAPRGTIVEVTSPPINTNALAQGTSQASGSGLLTTGTASSSSSTAQWPQNPSYQSWTNYQKANSGSQMPPAPSVSTASTPNGPYPPSGNAAGSVQPGPSTQNHTVQSVSSRSVAATAQSQVQLSNDSRHSRTFTSQAKNANLSSTRAGATNPPSKPSNVPPSTQRPQAQSNQNPQHPKPSAQLPPVPQSQVRPATGPTAGKTTSAPVNFGATNRTANYWAPSSSASSALPPHPSRNDASSGRPAYTPMVIPPGPSRNGNSTATTTASGHVSSSNQPLSARQYPHATTYQNASQAIPVAAVPVSSTAAPASYPPTTISTRPKLPRDHLLTLGPRLEPGKSVNVSLTWEELMDNYDTVRAHFANHPDNLRSAENTFQGIRRTGPNPQGLFTITVHSVQAPRPLPQTTSSGSVPSGWNNEAIGPAIPPKSVAVTVAARQPSILQPQTQMQPRSVATINGLPPTGNTVPSISPTGPTPAPTSQVRDPSVGLDPLVTAKQPSPQPPQTPLRAPAQPVHEASHQPPPTAISSTSALIHDVLSALSPTKWKPKDKRKRPDTDESDGQDGGARKRMASWPPVDGQATSLPPPPKIQEGLVTETANRAITAPVSPNASSSRVLPPIKVVAPPAVEPLPAAASLASVPSTPQQEAPPEPLNASVLTPTAVPNSHIIGVDLGVSAIDDLTPKSRANERPSQLPLTPLPTPGHTPPGTVTQAISPVPAETSPPTPRETTPPAAKTAIQRPLFLPSTPPAESKEPSSITPDREAGPSAPEIATLVETEELNRSSPVSQVISSFDAEVDELVDDSQEALVVEDLVRPGPSSAGPSVVRDDALQRGAPKKPRKPVTLPNREVWVEIPYQPDIIARARRYQRRFAEHAAQLKEVETQIWGGDASEPENGKDRETSESSEREASTMIRVVSNHEM